MSSTPLFNFVADIRFKSNANTTLQKLVSTHGFKTKPSDTPSNVHAPARLLNPGTFSQEMFSSARLTGAVKPSVAEIVISNDDGALDSWVELGTAGGEVTVWVGYEGSSNFPSGYVQVFTAQLFNVLADFTEIRLRLRDRSYLLDKPVVTDTFTGTGDLEGPTGFNQKKPLAILNPGYVPAICVDTVKQIYYVQSNAIQANYPVAVFEGGTEITLGVDYATLHDLQYIEPSEGTVRIYRGTVSGGYPIGPVYFRLAAPPIFDIRVRTYGTVMDPADPIHNTIPGYWTMTDMCRKAGLFDVLPSTMPVGAAEDLLIPGQYIADDRTFLDVLQSAAFSSQACFGFDRQNLFFCSHLKSPSALEGGEVYAASFTLDKISNVRRGFLSDMEGPVWQVNFHTGETWPSNLTNGADDAMREQLSRDPWQLALTGTSDQVHFNYVNSVTATLESKALINFGSVVGTYFGLYGAHRDVITFEVPFTLARLSLKLNDPVQIFMPRFGCISGRHFRIAAISMDLSARMITYKVWGGPAFTSGYSLGDSTTYNGGWSGGIGTDGGGTIVISATAQGKVLTCLASIVPGTTGGGSIKIIGPARASLITGSATGDGSGSGGGGPAVHAIPVTAAAMRPQVSNGCSAVQAIASTSDVDLTYLAFDGTVATYAQFGIPMPSSWNEGTITAKFHWSHGTASTPYAVQWAIAAVAVSDNDTIATTFGTPQVIVDTGGTADKMYTSSVTPAITVAGSPADGDYVFFRIYRDPTVAGDTLTVPARLHAVTILATIGSPDV